MPRSIGADFQRRNRATITRLRCINEQLARQLQRGREDIDYLVGQHPEHAGHYNENRQRADQDALAFFDQEMGFTAVSVPRNVHREFEMRNRAEIRHLRRVNQQLACQLERAREDIDYLVEQHPEHSGWYFETRKRADQEMLALVDGQRSE